MSRARSTSTAAVTAGRMSRTAAAEPCGTSPVKLTRSGSIRLAGRPARRSRIRRASSARPRITASTFSFTRRSGGRTVESRTSSGRVPAPSSFDRLPLGTSIQASAAPSSISDWADCGSTTRAVMVSGQPSGLPSSRSASMPIRIASGSALVPEKTKSSRCDSARRSSSKIAVRMPSVLESASSGYIAIGITSVMNSARRSRMNSSRSRRAIASRAGHPPVGCGELTRHLRRSWRRKPLRDHQICRRRVPPGCLRRRSDRHR